MSEGEPRACPVAGRAKGEDMKSGKLLALQNAFVLSIAIALALVLCPAAGVADEGGSTAGAGQGTPSLRANQLSAQAGEVPERCRLSKLAIQTNNWTGAIENDLVPSFDPTVREYEMACGAEADSVGYIVAELEEQAAGPITVEYEGSKGKVAVDVPSGDASGTELEGSLKQYSFKEGLITVSVGGEEAYVIHVKRLAAIRTFDITNKDGSAIAYVEDLSTTSRLHFYTATVPSDAVLTVDIKGFGNRVDWMTWADVNGEIANVGESAMVYPAWGEDHVWDLVIRACGEGAVESIYTVRCTEIPARIDIVEQPIKTIYRPGDSFDPEGLKAIAIYTNGDRVALDCSDLTISPEGPLSASVKSVSVSYQGATTYQPISFVTPLDGEGTEDSPFLLGTVSDYEYVRDLVNGGDSLEGAYLLQTADIELPSGWVPIGCTKDGNPGIDQGRSLNAFSGILDGGKHTITVPRNGKPLFGYVRGAEVRNLCIYGEMIAGAGLIDNLSGVGLAGTSFVLDSITLKSGSKTLRSGLVDGDLVDSNFAVCSAAFRAEIRNCIVEEGVTVGYGLTKDRVGGIIGRLQGTIENCTCAATVCGCDYVGGIIGMRDNALGPVSVAGCTFTGEVRATGEQAGGISGGVYDNSSAPNGVRLNISGCIVTGKVSGEDKVGGILGADSYTVQPWNECAFHDNSFTGTVGATGEGARYVGGVIGFYKSLNKCDGISSNYYAAGCGAERGIGGVQYVDTSCASHEADSGTLYFSTENDTSGCPEVKDCAWKIGLNRTDDPLGADSMALCWTDGAPDECVSITLSGGYKTEYLAGEELSTEGMSIVGTWRTGRTQAIDPADCEFSGYDPLVMDEQVVTVSYGSASTTFTVSVSKDAGRDWNLDARGTAYLSVSDDARYFVSDGMDAGRAVAYVPIRLADVAEWASSEEYAKLGLDEYRVWAPVEADYNYELTVLQLLAYAQARFSAEGAGGLAVSYPPGSLYIDRIFGHDCNMNYYVDGAYPMKADGSVGATCDEIALSDGDYIDIAMFTDWNFLNDPAAGFHYFMGLDGAPTHAFEAAAGREATIPLARIYERTDGYEPEAGWTVHWGTAEDWASYGSDSPTEKGSAVTGDDGAARITFPEVGTYYVWADGGKGVADATKDSIVSAPACAAVTVGPPADEATLGKLEAAIGEAASTASAIAASADGADVPAGTAWATPEAKAALDEALSAARAVLAGPGTTQRRAEEAIASVGEALSALMAASRDGLKIAPAADEASKVEAGKTYQVGGMSYRVTKAASGNAGGAVALTKAKDAKSVVVPAAVKLADGKSYVVDTIATKAFSKLKKLKKATVGANVKKIEKSAFFKTPKLKKLVVKTKLLKAKASVKGALKGSKARKLAVKAPKGMKKAYKKSFSKKNLKAPKKVTVK